MSHRDDSDESMTKGDFIANHPELTQTEDGTVYSLGVMGDDEVLSEDAVIRCPECGEWAWYSSERTACCGHVEVSR